MLLTGQLNYWEKNLSQHHFVHHKSHSDRLVTNCLSHGPPYPDYKLGNCHCFGDLQATGTPSELTKLKYWHV